MKQYVYLFLGALVLSLSNLNPVYAQCVPDMSLPDSVIIDPLPETEENPDGGIPDTACVNEFYETVLTFRAPSEVNTILGTLTIDSIVVVEDGVSGMPPGLDYGCNPGDCVFYPDSIGCIGVSGTATTLGQYNLGISVKIYSGAFSLDYTLPDESLAPGNYYIYVRPEGSAACDPSGISEGTSAGLSIQMAPNPAASYTQLLVNSIDARHTEVRLYNATGQLVRSAQWQLFPGENRYRIDTNNLPLGLYTAVLTDGREGVSTRLLVQR